MQKKWFYRNKTANYAIANEIGVHPAIIKIMADRGIEARDDMEKYLHPTMEQVSSGAELTDMLKGVDIMYREIMANTTSLQNLQLLI